MLLAAMTASGCGSIFSPKIEPHPDAPILITEILFGFAKGNVYDLELNAMVPCGWFYIGSKYDGWTLAKIRWQDRIDIEASNREGEPEPVDTEAGTNR